MNRRIMGLSFRLRSLSLAILMETFYPTYSLQHTTQLIKLDLPLGQTETKDYHQDIPSSIESA
jgi:hypothetical protein